MATPHRLHPTVAEHPISDADAATLGTALEHVFEAQQDLVIRRAHLLIEELIAKASSFASRSVLAVIGSLVAAAGWFVALAGLIDAFDDYFARYAVEIVVGAIHIVAGLALIFAPRWLSREPT